MKDQHSKKTSTGLAQFTVISEQIKIWDVKDQIRYFTSDTTSSNTGKFSGCCKRIEEYIYKDADGKWRCGKCHKVARHKTHIKETKNLGTRHQIVIKQFSSEGNVQLFCLMQS